MAEHVRIGTRLAALVFLAVILQAAGGAPPERIQSSDGQYNDDFGYQLSLNGNRLLVGARLADDPGVDSGAAYVFERSSDKDPWRETAKIGSPTGAQWDLFGRALWLAEDSTLIGSPGDDQGMWNSGAVYVYREVGGSWVQEQKIVPGDPQSNPGFALSLAGHGDFAVVGARRDSSLGFYVGSAYLLERDADSGSWFESAKLYPSDAQPSGQFGWSVAIHQQLLAVAAPFQRGKVFVFRRAADGSWTEEQILRSPLLGPVSAFGVSLAIRGKEIAVTSNEPALYIYRYEAEAWQLKQVLRVTGAEPGPRALARVAFDDRELVVGDPTVNGFSGSVHRYRRASIDAPWRSVGQIEGSRPLTSFGGSLLLSADDLYVAELDGEGASPGSGVVWAYPRRSRQSVSRR